MPENDYICSRWHEQNAREHGKTSTEGKGWLLYETWDPFSSSARPYSSSSAVYIQQWSHLLQLVWGALGLATVCSKKVTFPTLLATCKLSSLKHQLCFSSSCFWEGKGVRFLLSVCIWNASRVVAGRSKRDRGRRLGHGHHMWWSGWWEALSHVLVLHHPEVGHFSENTAQLTTTAVACRAQLWAQAVRFF